MEPFQQLVDQLSIRFHSREICVLQMWHHCMHMYPTLGNLGPLYIFPMGLVKVEDRPEYAWALKRPSS